MTDLLKPYLTQSVKLKFCFHQLWLNIHVFSYQLIYLIYYLYHDDLLAPTSLDAELHCWRVKWCDGELLEEAKGIDNPQNLWAL